MNVTTVQLGENKLRLLVGIASFGEKNLEFLKRIIRNYQNLPMDVDVVVFSNQPKDLGSSVKVIVGLPSKDPWSLPFAHKAYFAQNVDRYDLFIYSEDDMEVTEKNIHAFLQATPELKPQEIAGFLRYEMDESGNCSLPEVHGSFHWKPDSVKRRGAYTIAEFTNEHAALYLLTRDQLQQVIASGGFLRKPCKGRYDMLCTAATDPYTNCGFRKVICISVLGDFLIHHLSNRYTGHLGVSMSALKNQVGTLMEIANHQHPANTLSGANPIPSDTGWLKLYYEKPSEDMLRLVPAGVKTVLSVGCGCGATEARLKQRGMEVTAIPLDSVIGAEAARQGIKVVHTTLDECIKRLEGQQFDCVLIRDLLHLQKNPGQLLEIGSRFVAKGGVLMLAGPNFDRLPWLIRRKFGMDGFDKLRSFESSGLSICVPRTLTRQIKNAGLRIKDVCWMNHDFGRGFLSGKGINLGKFTARDWILRACRCVD
jgi:2-polyprenyl-3-methyl-5-hydroxy-6-metoxy-1,4-benzoquinol methylase